MSLLIGNSIKDQISSLNADIKRVKKSPSLEELQSLKARVDSLLSHFSNTSDRETLVEFSKTIQGMKNRNASQLSSPARTPDSAPSKSSPKVYSVEKLKSTFDILVKKAESGKLNIQHALTFQEILLGSKSAHKGDATMDAMEVGTEVLVTVAFESSAKKGSGPQIRSSSFNLCGQNYHVNLTRGDGACAIHALLGVRQHNGVYQYNGNPRRHFTDNLKAALNVPGNTCLKQLFTEAVTSHFAHTNTDASSIMLFGRASSTEGQAIKDIWDKLSQNANRIVNENKDLEAQLWLPLAEKNHNGVMDAVMVEFNQEKCRGKKDSRYHGMSEEQVLLMLKGNPRLLLDIVSTNQETFYEKIFDHDNANKIMAAKKVQQQALGLLEAYQRKFILSDRVVNHYIQVVNQPDYYFNTAEIHVGALLFDKKVQVVASSPPDYQIVPTEFLFNPGADGELVVIHHRGAHFSRCVMNGVVEAPQVRREFEGLVKNFEKRENLKKTVQKTNTTTVNWFWRMLGY